MLLKSHSCLHVTTYVDTGWFECRTRNSIILHAIIEDRGERVLWTTETVEVVHVNSPSHRSTVTFGLDEIHLDL